MDPKILWACVNFGTRVSSEYIAAGEMIVEKPATGILHEICLLEDLDIPDLEAS